MKKIISLLFVLTVCFSAVGHAQARNTDFPGYLEKQEANPGRDAPAENGEEAAKEGEETATAATTPEKADASDFDRALIIVEGDEGVGTGFLATIRERNFIVTNIHVIMGNREVDFRDINGRVYRPTAYFLSKEQDIAILPIEEEVSYSLKMAEDVGSLVRRGDKVVVLGNSLGGSVVTQLDGDVQGIGPKAIEVSATFVEGNSGSPIIHLSSGQVIGVATYITEISGDRSSVRGTRFEEVRRFGHRYDIIDGWDRATLEQMYEQGRLVNDFDKMLREYFALIDEILSRGGYSYRGFTHPDVIRDLTHYRGRMPRQMTASERDWASINREMKNRIQQRIDNTLRNMERQITLEYMKNRLDYRKNIAERIMQYL